jgi:hypothetical protein
MKRLRINFLVGTIALTGLVFLMATGLFFRFILPSGNGKIMSVCKLTRNEWGVLGLSTLLIISATLFLSPKGKNYPTNEINYKNQLDLNQILEGAHEKLP